MTGPDLLLGVDVGTARVKALAIDPAGDVLGEAERPTPWRHDRGRVEADPLALAELAATVAAEAAIRAGGRVLGVGVTGMAETGVLVDEHDRPLAPAIAWHDPRGDNDVIADELGAETFQTTTGLPLTPLPSLSKLLWLRRHHPETTTAARFYSVGEWVVRRLGGAPVAELSLASRTGLLELPTARPWDAATALLGGRSLLPELVVAGTPAGRADGSAPAVLRRAVLTVAGHDHQTAAYGVGAATDGALFDSLGTAEALVRTIRPPLSGPDTARLVADGMSVGWGVVADHLCVLAGLPTGLTLTRVAELVGARTVTDRVALGELALTAVADDQVPRLVDVGFQEFGIEGIRDGASPALLWRMAVDSLTTEADRVVARVDAVTGRHRHVVAAGGWLHNPAVLAAKRRQYPGLRTSDIPEPGAFGAARMAGQAAGVTPDLSPVT